MKKFVIIIELSILWSPSVMYFRGNWAIST